MIEMWNEFATTYNHELNVFMEYGCGILLLIIFIAIVVVFVISIVKEEKEHKISQMKAFEYLKNNGHTVMMIKDKPYVYHNGKWNLIL